MQPAHHMAAEGGCCWPHLLALMHQPRPGDNHPSCCAVCDPLVPERAREASATRAWKGVLDLCAGACVHLRSMSVPSSLVSNLFLCLPPILSICPPPLLSRAFFGLPTISKIVLSLPFRNLWGNNLSPYEFSRQILITTHCRQRLGKNKGLRGLYPPKDNDPKSLANLSGPLKGS